MADFRQGLAVIASVREEVQRCTNAQRDDSDHDGTEPERTERDWQSRRRKKRISKKLPDCFLCGQKHWMADCFKFPSRETKWRELSRQERCTLCLQKGHAVADCEREAGCSRCQGRHNKALCPSATSSADAERERSGSPGRQGMLLASTTGVLSVVAVLGLLCLASVAAIGPSHARTPTWRLVELFPVAG